MKSKFILSLALCVVLQANDADQAVNLSSLSLEDLFNIEVTSISRRAESQHLAPGVVTVISSQDIHQYGARHLRDVLDRVVGTQVLGSHQRPHNKTSIRGMNSTHQDDAVLLLLNGRPIYSGQDGGFSQDIYLGFPLETIERIEIIRGPGSVIYGTNAMAGVINLVTKDAKTAINETRVDIGAGSFGRQQLQLSTLMSGEDYSLNIGLNGIKSQGDSVQGIVDQDRNIGTYESGEFSRNLLINGRYQNFTFNTMVMNNTQDSGSAAFQLPSVYTEKRRSFFDIGYLYEINSGWDVSLNYSRNEGSYSWQTNETVGRSSSEDLYERIETIVRGNIVDDLNILLGANYVENSGAITNNFLPYVKRNNINAYTQLDYMLSPKQKVIAGVQYNHPQGETTDISSRAGFVQGFGENWWLKLLYSEAYRFPSLVEKYTQGAQVRGNPNLNPEKVATYDAQLIYQTSEDYFALTLYDTTMDNVIIRALGTPTTYANQPFIRFQGIEIEGRKKVAQDLNLIGNFSYQVNKSNEGVKNSTFAPQIMVKLGASYQGVHGMDIGVFNSYIGTSTDLNATNIAPAINPKADAYNLLTANISIDTGKMWGIGKQNHSFIALYLDNILDEKIFAPDLFYANKNNTIPSHWGRSANLTYTYKF
jgi:outer membrane receptor for ferrienterochelin and colicins